MNRPLTYHFPSALISISICLLLSINQVTAKIVEKKTVRYFRFDGCEYPLDSEGHITDANARAILHDIRRLYNITPPLTDKVYTLLNDIRDNLHRVYRGEVYEEILFTCIKTVANYAVYLQQPPEADDYPKKVITNSYLDYEKMDTFFYCGRMVRIISKPDMYESRGGRTYLYIKLSCVLAERFQKGDVFFKDGRARWIKHIHSKSSPPYKAELAKIKPKFEKEVLHELFDEAAKHVTALIEGFVATLHNNGNLQSTGFEEQWNSILDGIPRAIYKNVATDYPSGSKKLASSLVTLSLKYMNSKAAKSSLEQFAKQEGLHFTKPKPLMKKYF